MNMIAPVKNYTVPRLEDFQGYELSRALSELENLRMKIENFGIDLNALKFDSEGIPEDSEGYVNGQKSHGSLFDEKFIEEVFSDRDYVEFTLSSQVKEMLD